MLAPHQVFGRLTRERDAAAEAHRLDLPEEELDQLPQEVGEADVHDVAYDEQHHHHDDERIAHLPLTLAFTSFRPMVCVSLRIPSAQ